MNSVVSVYNDYRVSLKVSNNYYRFKLKLALDVNLTLTH